ncbi:MAG: glutamate formimidoyltransferase [Candidatus Eremiobacteraeota bacterium]|nr:glutamate formimidoyltransferase [Candidatus Eremiobacteraeota bacterium]
MAEAIVECIPNFSEGQRDEVIKGIAEKFSSVAGCKLLDCKPDKDHNRTVYTIIGSAAAVKEAVLNAIGYAAEHIDMECHRGEHPRIGACDVVPFVPIARCTMEECVALSKEVASEIWKRHGIPVYLYEESAAKPERRNLADIRKGEYEVLKREISLEGRKPDVGEARLHPKAGAAVVGARKALIAYNINLSTSNIKIAKEIAKRVRARSGGLAYVKALGVMLKERNIAQVSMNLTDFSKSAVYTVFEMVKSEATRYGVHPVGSEVIGLLPLEALVEVARFYLRIEEFQTAQILETHLMDL